MSYLLDMSISRLSNLQDVDDVYWWGGRDGCGRMLAPSHAPSLLLSCLDVFLWFLMCHGVSTQDSSQCAVKGTFNWTVLHLLRTQEPHCVLYVHLNNCDTCKKKKEKVSCTCWSETLIRNPNIP